MDIVLTGSIAFDYIMRFPGRFRDHILPDHLDRLSLSFLVDSLIRRRGGIAANIAFTLGLLGEHPKVMATVGEDFEEYRAWLEAHGVDTSPILVTPDLLTASFFVNTDEVNAQIASFYAGAMARAAQLHFSDLAQRPDLVVISPNDPQAMVQYVEECRQAAIPFFYDPSQQIVRLDAHALRDGITACRALFSNDYEFNMILQKTGLDLAEVRRSVPLVVITCGDAGTDVYSNGDHFPIPAVRPAHLVDPTGVGDAFRGGFLKGYVHGLPPETCGRIGALAATYCLESEGTQGHRFDLPSFIARYRQLFDGQGDVERLR